MLKGKKLAKKSQMARIEATANSFDLVHLYLLYLL